MTDHNTGGPAFPLNVTHKWFEGMTLRDYFAAAAMQAVITGRPDYRDQDWIAKAAYMMADAMLAAREVA